MNKYYLIGIKGTGMSALAQVLSDLGHEVKGSDVDEDYKTSAGLIKRKIVVLPFDALNITDEYIYVIGNAYSDNHVEVSELKKKGYPYSYYHEFLSKMKGIQIAISGTHGKTTTTTLIKELLKDLECAYVIGDGSGGAKPNYDYFIYEACEYKNHFLSYYPHILIINNIELDHPDFFNSLDEVMISFKKASQQAKILIINGDDLNAAKILHPKRITFGFKATNDFVIEILNERIDGFDIKVNNRFLKVPFVGIHMIYNTVASYVVAKTIGLTHQEIQENLLTSNLPKRRMEMISIDNLILVDDYAHHPTEIKALHQALHQKYPHHLIKAIFQPHTYSRTLTLGNDFVDALKKFDEVYLQTVFASAREKNDDYLQLEVNKLFKDFKQFTVQVLNNILPNNNEVWVFLGAGTINHYMEDLIKKIRNMKIE